MNAVQAQRYQAQAAAQAQAQHAQRAMVQAQAQAQTQAQTQAQAQAQAQSHVQAQAQSHLQARRISTPVDAAESANRAAVAQQMSAEQQQRSAQVLKRGAIDSLMGEGLRVAKRGKPTDRSLPAQLRGYVPESELHAQMCTLERQLDWNVSRKRAELLQSLQQRQTPSARRTLRMYLSNTVAGQTWQQRPQETGAEAPPLTPTWTFKVEGRLLPLNEDEQPPKFSKLIKSVVIELERDAALYQDGGNVIKWEQTPESQTQSGVDGFEITRSGDAPLKAKVHLFPASNREQFSLHPPLANLLDMRQGSRTEVMEALWAYIRDHKLLDESDRRVVKCDEALQQLFQAARLSFHHLPEMVIRLLQPVPPIVIEYWIRTDVPSHQADNAYDIEIDVDNLDYLHRAHDVFAGFDTQSAPSREIAEIDERVRVAPSHDCGPILTGADCRHGRVRAQPRLHPGLLGSLRFGSRGNAAGLCQRECAGPGIPAWSPSFGCEQRGEHCGCRGAAEKRDIRRGLGPGSGASRRGIPHGPDPRHDARWASDAPGPGAVGPTTPRGHGRGIMHFICRSTAECHPHAFPAGRF